MILIVTPACDGKSYIEQLLPKTIQLVPPNIMPQTPPNPNGFRSSLSSKGLEELVEYIDFNADVVGPVFYIYCPPCVDLLDIAITIGNGGRLGCPSHPELPKASVLTTIHERLRASWRHMYPATRIPRL